MAVNPYRGCEHGCVYCYARPTHAYLGYSPGLDFETRLVAKANAVEALRAELSRPGCKPSPINIGSATDAYQPIEREWRLTRGLLELMLETRHPLTIVTKNALVARDLDLLAELARRNLVVVYMSVTTLDAAMARSLEPRAAAPWRRLEAVRSLTDAGVPVGVLVAPIIPFINDESMEHILEAAKAAGAHYASYTVLRLPWEVKTLFEDWLHAHFPDRAQRPASHRRPAQRSPQRSQLWFAHAWHRHLGRLAAPAFFHGRAQAGPEPQPPAAQLRPIHAARRGRPGRRARCLIPVFPSGWRESVFRGPHASTAGVASGCVRGRSPLRAAAAGQLSLFES